MRHIKPSSMWVGLVIILPLFWKGITYKDGYSITVPSSVRVQEGLCVTIPCNFIANYRNTFSNSFGYWKLGSTIVASNDKSDPGSKPNFNLTGNPDSGDCTLTITDARRGDAGEYYFRFEESKNSKVQYDYKYPKKPTITVPDLTEEPIISDPGTVIAGINKTLTCTPPGNCPATSLVIQWRKSNVVGVWKKSSTVTFTPSLNDDQESITCQMINSRGKTTEKTILLHVYSPPAITITWVLNGCIPEKKMNTSASFKVDEGSSVTLRCSIQSNLTMNVTWMDGKNDILQHGIGTELELRLGKVTISHTGTYTCSALTKYVINVTSINVTVQHRSTNPGITNNSSEDKISYRDIAIAFICGMSTPILIFLLYKLIIRYRKKMTKKAAYVTAEELSASTEPTTEDIYMNVNKPEEKAEEATNNNIQLDSSGVTLDEDNLHYSSVAFTAKSSQVSSSSPET